MASKNICTSCLRTLRHQGLPKQLSTRRIAAFTTSSTKYASDPKKNPYAQQPLQPPPPKDWDAHTPSTDSSPITNFAATLRSNSALRSTTEPYIAYGSTEDLFLECSKQCSYTIPSALETPPGTPPQNAAGDHLGAGVSWWLEPKSKGGLGLEVTFNSWAQVLYLHMWLLTVRLRCFPEKYVKDWHQNLLDHFFYAAEDRMATWHGMSARGVRNRNLKDLWTQWRGVQLAYDEGLIKDDAVMGTAVWRNVFKADPNVDLKDLGIVTAYIMRELQRLGKLDDMTVTEGKVRFGNPRTIVEETGLSKEAVLKQAAKSSMRVEEGGMPPEHQPS